MTARHFESFWSLHHSGFASLETHVLGLAMHEHLHRGVDKLREQGKHGQEAHVGLDSGSGEIMTLVKSTWNDAHLRSALIDLVTSRDRKQVDIRKENLGNSRHAKLNERETQKNHRSYAFYARERPNFKRTEFSLCCQAFQPDPFLRKMTSKSYDKAKNP